jgi:hypothetical protein
MSFRNDVATSGSQEEEDHEAAGLFLEHAEAIPVPHDYSYESINQVTQQEAEEEILEAVLEFYPDEEEDVVLETTSPTTEDSLHRAYLKSLPAVPVPVPARRIPVVYDLTRDECGTSISTENRYNGIWAYWNKYCLSKQRPLLYPRFGLGVYEHKADAFGPDTSPSADDYQRIMVHDFYKFLLHDDVVVGKSTMTNVASFLNAHIKAEYLARHKAAMSQNPRAAAIRVGDDLEVQRLVKQASRKKAKSNRELFLDIQASIDSRITPDEALDGCWDWHYFWWPCFQKRQPAADCVWLHLYQFSGHDASW